MAIEVQPFPTFLKLLSFKVLFSYVFLTSINKYSHRITSQEDPPSDWEEDVHATLAADATLCLNEELEFVKLQPEQDSDEHNTFLGIEDFLQLQRGILHKRVWAFQYIPMHSKIFQMSLHEGRLV